jgi:hypothetical protein
MKRTATPSGVAVQSGRSFRRKSNVEHEAI